MNILMSKKFNLGKIDYLGNGRKTCPVEIEVELRGSEEKPELSICGTVWNHKRTDCYLAGQCIDDLTEYFKGNKLYNKLARLWRLYHLNSMHSGTEAQDKLVNEYLKDHDYDYKEICKYLMLRGLYEDNGYTYGSAWLYRPIPEADLKEIKELLS